MNNKDYKTINELIETMEFNSLEKKLGLLSRNLYYFKKDILENFSKSMDNTINIIKENKDNKIEYENNNLNYIVKFFPNLRKANLKDAKQIILYFETEWSNYLSSKKININYNDFKNNIKNILQQLYNLENIDIYIKKKLKDDNEFKTVLFNQIKDTFENEKLYNFSNNTYLFEKINRIKKNIFNEIYLSIESIHEEFKTQIESKNLKNNDASLFLDILNNDFLKDKIEKELIYIGGKYKKIEIFKDKSFLLYDSKDNIIFSKILDFDYNQLIINDLMLSIIENKLRKNKNYSNKFTKLFQEDNNFINAMDMIDNLLKYQNLIKSKKVDIVNIKFLTFEKFNDLIMSIKYESEIEKYAKSIISKKYINLYNHETFDYFKILYDNKIEKHDIQQYIGTKLAGFKDSQNFNDALKRMCNIFSGFTFENTIKEAELQNIEISYKNEDENLLILKIKDFETSKNMGSPSWCISRSENYLRDYLNNRNQYFIYDFNKNESDISSLIGVTLNKDNTIYAAHYKNDKTIKHSDEFLQKFIQIILKKDKSNLLNYKNS